MLDAKIASALNKTTENSQFKKKVSFEEQKSSKREPVSTRKTDRVHDARLLSSDWRSWYSTGLCWSILCCSSWCQYSGIRYKMGRSSVVVYVKKSRRWYLGKSEQIKRRESDQLRTVLELYDMEISSEDIGSQLSEAGNNGEREECRLETSITKLWRKAWENWIRSSGLRIERD